MYTGAETASTRPRRTEGAQMQRRVSWWTKLQILMRKMYCYHHHHIPHLMLFDKDGPNLSCNHGGNGGDVIFKSVGEAASSRDTVLVEMRHMLSHAFHLFKQSHINTHTHNKCESDENKIGNIMEMHAN